LSAEIETSHDRAAGPEQRGRDRLRGLSGRSRLPRQKEGSWQPRTEAWKRNSTRSRRALEALRKDITSRLNSFGDVAADELMTRGRAAVGRAADRANDLRDDASNEATRRGRKGAVALEQQIQERPFISIWVAFGIGGLISR
jgi:ElaB/YqjD/DUF883 family membrane-anchored ribosome-binding protein